LNSPAGPLLALLSGSTTVAVKAEFVVASRHWQVILNPFGGGQLPPSIVNAKRIVAGTKKRRWGGILQLFLGEKEEKPAERRPLNGPAPSRRESGPDPNRARGCPRRSPGRPTRRWLECSGRCDPGT